MTMADYSTATNSAKMASSRVTVGPAIVDTLEANNRPQEGPTGAWRRSRKAIASLPWHLTMAGLMRFCVLFERPNQVVQELFITKYFKVGKLDPIENS